MPGEMNMRRYCSNLVTLFLLLVFTGCSSMETQFGDPDNLNYPPCFSRAKQTIPQIYSGTWVNLAFAKDAFNLNCDTDPAGQGYVTCCLFPPYFIIDFPLSLIADTLLLPLTIPKQIIHGSIGAPKPSDKPPSESNNTP